MKQLLQRLDTGETLVVEAPVPAVSTAHVLVASRATIVSPGTERMLIDFGRASLLEKARSQPDKVKQTLEKIRADGLGPTLEAVRTKLGNPVALGYSHAGEVVELGDRARTKFRIGDRVVTNGSHAEYVRVPMTLAARIPETVDFETAAFTPLAAIALQGIRLANLALGETVVVYGLGLIGLLAVQLVRAHGCRVLAIDPDVQRCALATSLGADALEGDAEAASHVLQHTGGVGADAVLLTLSAKSDEPVHLAAQMSRKRGRLVLIGVTGLQLQRDDFYKKELSFAVSCSYGPGRYDPVYEEEGIDYPLPFVRWTEQRNFEAVLSLMADGRLVTAPLVSHRFDIQNVIRAYDLVTSATPSLGIVITYGHAATASIRPLVRTIERRPTTGGSTAVIGSGNYSTRVILPALKAANISVRTIASSAGTSAAVAGNRFDVERVTTDVEEVFADSSVDSIFVLTRHDSHATLARRALLAGKHVFVEKPLAINREELADLEEVARVAPSILTVGFNRRYADLMRESQRIVSSRAGTLTVVATVNAGAVPQDHWTQNAEAGGGRLVGEAVHWLDLARALVGMPIRSIRVTTAADASGQPIEDIAHLSMAFTDGSTAVIHYIANGAKSYPKERIECFFDGKTVVIDNWRRLRRFGVPGPLWERSQKMDKGQAGQIAAWKRAVETALPPIPLDELFEVSRFAIQAAELARSGGGSTS